MHENPIVFKLKRLTPPFYACSVLSTIVLVDFTTTARIVVNPNQANLLVDKDLAKARIFLPEVKAGEPGRPALCSDILLDGLQLNVPARTRFGGSCPAISRSL